MPFITLSPDVLAEIDTENDVAHTRDVPVSPIFYENYDRSEGEEGPTLLLIHGAGGNYLSWPSQLRRLSNASVYAIDLPGHGQSEAWGSDEGTSVTNSVTDPIINKMSIEEYAAMIRALIRQLALQQVILVGHSMGAAIALTCAFMAPNEQPDPVVGLVLVGAGATLPVNRRIFVGLREEFADMTAKLVDWMYAPGLAEKHRVRAIDDLRRNLPAQLIADFEACNAYDRRDDLDQVTLPTLIICGELDKMTPLSSSEELAHGIHRSELVVIPGGGHMVMLEHPEEVIAGIQPFIDLNFRRL